MSQQLDTSTVTVEELAGFENVLRMVWSSVPDTDDVIHAFWLIKQHLNSSVDSVDIVVDIQSNPVFPLKTTIDLAMRTNQHEQLGKWLVIGGNRNAKFIGKMVMSFGKRNVLWFDDETEVRAYLQSGKISS